MDSGHPPANSELWPDRFPAGTRGVDRGEIPGLSDCGGDVESVFTRDQMLANISFYWFTGAIGSSFYPYYFRLHRPWIIRRAPPSWRRPVTPNSHAKCFGRHARWPRRCSATFAAGRSCRRAGISRRWNSLRHSRRTCAPFFARCGLTVFGHARDKNFRTKRRVSFRPWARRPFAQR